MVGAGLIVTGGRWRDGASRCVALRRVAERCVAEQGVAAGLGLIGVAQTIRQPVQSAQC